MLHAKNKTKLDLLPVCNIDSRAKLDALVQQFDESWIFRGQEDASWDLLSSYDRKRNDTKKVQKIREDYNYNVEEFNGIQYAKKLFHKTELSDIEMLAYLQHYGTSTRLLDFSFSFYVAFAFAFENPVRKSRAIWAVNLNKLIEPYVNNEIKNDIMATIEQPLKGPEQDFNIGYDAESNANARWKFRKEYNHLHRNLFQEKINTFITNFPKKDGKEIPLDILPYFADGNNPRINAQNGLFLFPTSLESTFLENCQASLQIDFSKNQEIRTVNNFTIIKIVFDELFFPIAQQILHTMNISPRTLYPDETELAKSIHLF